MNFRPCLIVSAILSAGLLAAPAFGQSNSEIEALRQELKLLREEVAAMKKQQQASTPAAAAAPASDRAAAASLADRVEQLEIKSNDAVVKGDIDGGFRLPGSETSIRLYGFAEAHLIHDLKATAPGDDFTNLPEQQLAGSGASKGKTKLTAQTSRFGFETSTPTGAGPFTTKLEMDFYAYCGAECNRNRLRVRHAYGQYGGWLIGQTWSTFMDLDDIPETVDFNGPIGTPFSRRTMIRYAYALPEVATFTFALEDPTDGARLPNLVARVDKTFDWGAVNARVMFHEKRGDTDTGSASRRSTAFGVGGSFKLSSQDLLVGQYTRADGDTDALYGSNGFTIDADNKIVLDKNQGLALGWTRTFDTQLRGTIGFGMNRGKLPSTIDGYGDYNRTLRQAHFNLIYSPIKGVELGAEYIYGLRKTFDDQKGTLSRLDLMGRYAF